jgi:hypothetical protein
VYLDMLARSVDVHELDDDREIDGEPMTGVTADVGYADMLEAQGLDAETVIASLEDRDDAPDNAREVIDAFVLPVEVWLDPSGHVRELTIDIGESFDRVADELGEHGPITDLVFSTTMSFDDDGDDGIEVPVPAAGEVTDITDVFVALQTEPG